eukprot:sb/3472616/
MNDIGPKESYHQAFVTINGENYRCLGITQKLENGVQYKFVGEATYSRGYIERVASTYWHETQELPLELQCRNWVQSTYFDDKMTDYGPKESYHEAFVTINGENYRCLGLTQKLDNGQLKFVGEGVRSRGFIERVYDGDWEGTQQLPLELQCRNWVQTTYFDDK